MSTIAERLAQVRQRIALAEQAYGRPTDSVSLLAVSKTKPVSAILAAIEAGQHAFGENYLQDALPKQEALAGHDIEWHFIGPIQSNKTKQIAAGFDWVHSLDREKIARRLNEQRPQSLEPLNVCLQVNVSGEVSKAGAEPDEVLALARAVSAFPRLRLRGLMCIPAPADGLEAQRRPFRQLRELQELLLANAIPVDTLSMGMSGDLEAAVAEGSTLVRVGTDIFGARG